MRSGNTKGGIYSDKIFPNQSVLTNLTGENLKFSTFFKTSFEKDFEEKNVAFEKDPAMRLVKGLLGEVYQVGNFVNKYTQYNNNLYIPKTDEMLKFVKVTKSLFELMNKSDKFNKIADDALQLETSYGGVQTVKKGDYVRIDNDNLYRVKGDVFNATYEIVPYNAKNTAKNQIKRQ